ncbi:MAG: glycosyltransferase family 4 protein [Acidobacteriales bacterium]|nr:glycosyltransferase family 4 protein [Terriglobales bacterium]
MAATVHDVAQLALRGNASGGAAVRTVSRFLFRDLRRHARLLLFNSEFTRAEFTRCVGVSPAEKVVTPLGVEPRWFDAIPSPAAAVPYFVCVGNVRPHKNLRLLLTAFMRVAVEVPHKLVVIGQHSGFRTRDEDVLKDLNAPGDRVQFLGSLPDALVHQLVAGADAMILPSLYEGFGLPALEAMAAKCMVLASTAGALPEICGNAARYFDPTSVEALTALLREQASMDQHQRNAWVERGQERARQFTWNHTADLTANALERILQSGN